MLESGLPDIVSDDEDLARFLTQGNHFNLTGVRHNAYMPNPRDGRKSVSRHGRVPIDKLWKLSEEQGLSAMAAAIVQAGKVRKEGLDVEANEPPPRHADILGYPEMDDPVMTKAACKEIAMVLASSAELVLPGN